MSAIDFLINKKNALAFAGIGLTSLMYIMYQNS